MGAAAPPLSFQAILSYQPIVVSMYDSKLARKVSRVH